jgi:hypothetical protein
LIGLFLAGHWCFHNKRFHASERKIGSGTALEAQGWKAFFKSQEMLDVEAHSYNPIPWEAEAG